MTRSVGKRMFLAASLAAGFSMCLAAFSGLLPAAEAGAFQVTYYYLPG